VVLVILGERWENLWNEGGSMEDSSNMKNLMKGLCFEINDSVFLRKGEYLMKRVFNRNISMSQVAGSCISFQT
jgi:hypothetical protein